MSNYIKSVAEFCSLSPFNEDQAAELEAKRPGFIMAQCSAESSTIDARGVKRGDVPFRDPYPDQVKRWVADLVTPRVFEALGVSPTDEIQARIDNRETRTLELLKEFANPQTSLLLIPLQQGLAPLQANDTVTLAYSEQSPFTSKHTQYDSVRSNRRYG